jgi:hypothetical protein
VVVVLHCSSCTLYCASLLLLVWRSAFLIKFADSKKKNVGFVIFVDIGPFYAINSSVVSVSANSSFFYFYQF